MPLRHKHQREHANPRETIMTIARPGPAPQRQA
jgi:hypothetical protein